MTTGYLELCDSGIPWIGAVPCHWGQTQFRAAFSPKKAQNKGMIEDNLLSLSYGRIVPRDIASSDGLLPQSFETYQIVDGDDIIFRFTDLQNDKRSLRSARVTERGIITSAYLAATPTGINPRYAEYLMRSYDLAKVFYGLGGGVRQSLKFSDVALLPVLLPPEVEQHTIADYLDRETQRIDELIAEQSGLIEILRERRVALISRAVRRGLDESVEMYKTGVDWLGEVPAHWDVRRLKYSMESAVPGVWGSDPLGDESDVLCVRVADFDRPRLQVGQDVRTVRSVKSSDRLPRLLEPEDLLIEKSGGTAINPVGFVAMYKGPAETAVYANFIARMRPAEGQVPRYWLYAHAASYATRLTARSVKQTTGIQNLDQTSYFDEKFPFPPADEQRKIAEYLDDQTSRIDALIAESEDLIALSQERRSALITAAVTGQIDVRTAA